MKIKALTICGSLRSGSSNAELLEAYIELAPPSIEFRRLETLGSLPLYNPDLDVEETPKEVSETRKLVSESDVLVISTPEYIHALPAAMKNLLEWLVSDPSFYGKAVVILHANESSKFALESLSEVLNTMSAKIMQEACVVVSLGSNQRKTAEILKNETWKDLLQRSSFTLAENMKRPDQSRADNA